ncbi:TPR repeat-containing protein [Shewanella halifaxensis HAW-EB4]|uniref:TPR repeat-containing protein n=1 Tax=Shewanella halifaxensis (strain HAW-EB4) TaxID=458817 RepID=B0TVT8_SHEHH|nr:tetratricopeptide repeat protein [Shewanella halifaxensis]ABZ78391.1 TPR repeat-containing protein [Shewanella halifaxensis HAW-EB4]
MSVINKMLKDLDKRQQPHGLESMATPQIAHKANAMSKRPLVLTSLLSLVIGGLVVFLATGLLQPNAEADSQANQMSAQSSTSTSDVKKLLESSKSDGTLVKTKAEVSVEPKLGVTVLTPSQKAPTIQTSTIAASTVSEATKTKSSVPTEATTQVIGRSEPTVKQADVVKSASSLQANTRPDEQNKRQTIQNRSSSDKTQHAVANEAAASTVKMSVAPASKRSSELYSSGNMAVKEVKLSPEQLAQKQMMLATDAQQQGLHSDALTYYEAALAYNPALHQARRLAAALYYGQNKLAQAAKLLEQGQLLFPQEYEFSLLLARVQQAAGQNEQALKSLAMIPDASELAIKKWHQQSDLAQKQQDYPVAEQSFRQLAKHEPYQGRWWMGLGYALDAQQKYTEAKLAYNQALSQGNLSAQAKVYVDNRLLQLGAY